MRSQEMVVIERPETVLVKVSEGPKEQHLKMITT